VRDSDGTLIVNRGRLDGGTLLTAELALGRYRKPLLVVQLGRRIRGERFPRLASSEPRARAERRRAAREQAAGDLPRRESGPGAAPRRLRIPEPAALNCGR